MKRITRKFGVEEERLGLAPEESKLLGSFLAMHSRLEKTGDLRRVRAI